MREVTLGPINQTASARFSVAPIQPKCDPNAMCLYMSKYVADAISAENTLSPAALLEGLFKFLQRRPQIVPRTDIFFLSLCYYLRTGFRLIDASLIVLFFLNKFQYLLENKVKLLDFSYQCQSPPTF
jgi:hypothetical protein